MSGNTHADDCELMMRVLGDAPAGGMSMHDMQNALDRLDAHWSLMMINDTLCAIRDHIKHEKTRRNNRKVTLYSLKGK